MITITRLIALILGVVQGVLSYMKDRTLIQKGRLERDNASLKESIRRATKHREISNRPTPDNTRDILDRM
jgi:hypothetical protein